MTTKNKNLIVLTLTMLLLVSLVPAKVQAANAPDRLPVTGQAANQESAPALKSSGAGTASSVAVGSEYSFSVVQSGNSVPSGANILGQYATAAAKKNIGLLAHNYLAGATFSAFSPGMEVVVTFSDGSEKTFVITKVLRYQATDPSDFNKPFIDGSGKQVSARSVFNQAYKSSGLTFQTCISAGGSNSWGILFVQAVPKK